MITMVFPLPAIIVAIDLLITAGTVAENYKKHEEDKKAAEEQAAIAEYNQKIADNADLLAEIGSEWYNNELHYEDRKQSDPETYNRMLEESTAKLRNAGFTDSEIKDLLETTNNLTDLAKLYKEAKDEYDSAASSGGGGKYVADAVSQLNSVTDSNSSSYEYYSVPVAQVQKLRSELVSYQKELAENVVRREQNQNKAYEARQGYEQQVVGGQKKAMKAEMKKLSTDRKSLAQDYVNLTHAIAKKTEDLNEVAAIESSPVSDENDVNTAKRAADIGVSVTKGVSSLGSSEDSNPASALLTPTTISPITIQRRST